MLNKNTKTGKTVEVNWIFFFFAAASATSSPATLGMKERRDSMRDYQSSHSTMQFYNYREVSSNHKKQYTGTLFKAEACCCLLPPSSFSYQISLPFISDLKQSVRLTQRASELVLFCNQADQSGASAFTIVAFVTLQVADEGNESVPGQTTAGLLLSPSPHWLLVALHV